MNFVGLLYKKLKHLIDLDNSNLEACNELKLSVLLSKYAPIKLLDKYNTGYPIEAYRVDLTFSSIKRTMKKIFAWRYACWGINFCVDFFGSIICFLFQL